MICVAVSSGVLFRKEHVSNSASTVNLVLIFFCIKNGRGRHTSQSIDRPLLKLFEGDFRSRRGFIEVETMRIIVLFECRIGKLAFFMIQYCPTLCVYSIDVLPYHFACVGDVY